MTHRAAEVSGRAIELALRGQKFQLDDVTRQLSDPPSRQTVYRVLCQLDQDEWIEQRGKHWEPDIKAQGLSGNEEQKDRGMSFDAEDLLGGT